MGAMLLLGRPLHSRTGEGRGHRVNRRRALRIAATLLVTGLATAYILWRINLGETGHVLAHASIGWWLVSCAIWVTAVWPLSWRWRKLLASGGVHERLGWLVRTTFVSYAAAQVLPTSLGGDASRIYETARRHPGSRGPAAGTVLLERALGILARTLNQRPGGCVHEGASDVRRTVAAVGAGGKNCDALSLLARVRERAGRGERELLTAAAGRNGCRCRGTFARAAAQGHRRFAAPDRDARSARTGGRLVLGAELDEPSRDIAPALRRFAGERLVDGVYRSRA